MKKSFKRNISTRRNRLKRRSGKIFFEIVKTGVLFLVIGTLTSVMVYTYIYLFSCSCFQLKEIKIRGCERVPKDKIMDLAGVTPMQDNIFGMNLDRIRQKVEVDPWVREVFLGRELPDRLVIEIRERDAAALICRNGGMYVVDWNADPFMPLRSEDALDLPVLTGICDADDDIDRELLKEGIDLMTFISSRSDYSGLDNVAEIHADKVYGFSIITNDGLCLRVGFGKYERKFQQLDKVMVDLSTRNLDRGFLCIDLVSEHSIVVQRAHIVNPEKRTRGYKT